MKFHNDPTLFSAFFKRLKHLDGEKRQVVYPRENKVINHEPWGQSNSKLARLEPLQNKRGCYATHNSSREAT